MIVHESLPIRHSRTVDVNEDRIGKQWKFISIPYIYIFFFTSNHWIVTGMQSWHSQGNSKTITNLIWFIHWVCVKKGQWLYTPFNMCNYLSTWSTCSATLWHGSTSSPLKPVHDQQFPNQNCHKWHRVDKKIVGSRKTYLGKTISMLGTCQIGISHSGPMVSDQSHKSVGSMSFQGGTFLGSYAMMILVRTDNKQGFGKPKKMTKVYSYHLFLWQVFTCMFF